MRILLVKPDKEAFETEIKGDLISLQETVGGYIQAIYPFEDPVALICNDESKLMGLPLNRALYDNEGRVYDIIAGDFFLTGLSQDNFSDLPDELMEKYREHFKYPEIFIRSGNEIIVMKQTEGQAESITEKGISEPSL